MMTCNNRSTTRKAFTDKKRSVVLYSPVRIFVSGWVEWSNCSAELIKIGNIGIVNMCKSVNHQSLHEYGQGGSTQTKTPQDKTKTTTKVIGILEP